MSYPAGVETVTLTYGRSVRPDGTELATTLTPAFTGTKTATWAAPGTCLIPVTLTLSAAEGVIGHG